MVCAGTAVRGVMGASIRASRKEVTPPTPEPWLRGVSLRGCPGHNDAVTISADVDAAMNSEEMAPGARGLLGVQSGRRRAEQDHFAPGDKTRMLWIHTPACAGGIGVEF